MISIISINSNKKKTYDRKVQMKPFYCNCNLNKKIYDQKVPGRIDGDSSSAGSGSKTKTRNDHPRLDREERTNG